MPRLGLLISTLALMPACRGAVNIDGKRLPQAEVSTHRVDFGEVGWGTTVLQDITISNGGELPLGIETIALGTNEMEQNFTLHLGTTVDCDGSRSDNSAESDDEADDGADTGLAIDVEGDESAAASLINAIIVKPDCEYTFQVSITPTSVGQIYSSVILDFATDDHEDPTYYRDPDRFRDTIILQASSEKGAGNIVLSPRTLNFGHPNEGEEQVRYIEIHNVGSGSLTLEEPTFDTACDERFSFDLHRLAGGLELEGRTSTLLPVTYMPTASGRAECEMTLNTSDMDTPTSRVSLRAQFGTDPLCTPPTLNLISPDPGTLHGTTDDLVLELRIADADQPPTTLNCSVTSAFNTDEDIDILADCTPYSESGYTLVNVPVSMLLEGTDTLIVTVRDECGFETVASTSVLYLTGYPPSDDDGDGFEDGPVEHVDCDDDDPWVYPFATELFDGKDNDCDGLVDEGTEGMDDDGDGFSEIEGDCNDFDDTIYPGAPELTDTKDNDCDGVVDDNTGLSDDDGDGFAETDNDCNDNDPDIHPAATEYCDGIDNNCNGLKDHRDGCIEIDAAPMILGEIQMGVTALGPGESTIMSLDVFDPDGTELIFAWQEDPLLLEAGHDGFDSVTTQTVTWTAPSHLSSSSPGEVYTLYVVVTDPDGNSDWAFGEVTVYPDPVALNLGAIHTESNGCGSSSDDEASSAALLAPLFLLTMGIRRRRRRED
jgi:MYXO-CTERM domain-containing protein